MPPPVETGEGIPRFARDFIQEEEEPIRPPAFAEAPEGAQLKPTVEQGVPSVEAPAAPGAHPEVLPAVEEKVEEKPAEGQKDLRQRLRDFLKRIRERLGQLVIAGQLSGRADRISAGEAEK